MRFRPERVFGGRCPLSRDGYATVSFPMRGGENAHARANTKKRLGETSIDTTRHLPLACNCSNKLIDIVNDVLIVGKLLNSLDDFQ